VNPENSSVPAATAARLLHEGIAPADLRVEGTLDYSTRSNQAPPRAFPPGLRVDVLNLSGRFVFRLPERLQAYELILSESAVRGLPHDLKVKARLDLSQCERLEQLPSGLTVGSLILRNCTNLKALPEGLDVWFLDLSGCWALETWPESARVRSGHLRLRGCTALRQLPSSLGRLSALNVRDCPNLKTLPPNLVVTGWLDLAYSGITEEGSLPPGLADTQLRWSGVNIDRRIAFHPETIQVDEVLSERNSERRRVLLDRYGYGRFLRDAGAEIVDHDADPGGVRQLLRIKLEGDEDLVALSCHCPSTRRQYIIRVPPQTPTCHSAAAWIAGFDNPDDYRPLAET